MTAPPEGERTSALRDRRTLAVGLVALLVVGLVVWGVAALLSGGDSSEDTAPSTDPSVPPVSLGTDFTPGSGETVEPGELRVARPVGLRDRADLGGGLGARVVRVRAIEGKANGPGEVAGPALQVTVAVTNRSSDPVELAGVQVVVLAGRDRVPAIPLSEGSRPFAGSVAADGEARGTYVVGVPFAQRSVIRVEVTSVASGRTVVFRGDPRR